jgi:hypothetical protein
MGEIASFFENENIYTEHKDLKELLGFEPISFCLNQVGLLSIRLPMNLPKAKLPDSERLFERMAPQLAASFSPAQRQALQEALTPRSHTVELRFIAPFWPKFYLVILAGADTRDRPRSWPGQIWKPLNFVVVVGGILTGLLTLLGMMQFPKLSQSSLMHWQAAPAGIPFKADRSSCEQSGRIWQDNTCIDYDHNPTF